MYKRFKPNYTNIFTNFDQRDILYLYKGNMGFENNDKLKWINVDVNEGIYLLQKIIDCRGNKETLLLLMHKDIVIRDLLKSIKEKNIVEKLRNCLIIPFTLYNEKYFKHFKK